MKKNMKHSKRGTQNSLIYHIPTSIYQSFPLFQQIVWVNVSHIAGKNVSHVCRGQSQNWNAPKHDTAVLPLFHIRAWYNR